MQCAVHLGITWASFTGVTTDDTPSGAKIGVVVLLNQKFTEEDYVVHSTDITYYHLVIHCCSSSQDGPDHECRCVSM